MAPLILRYLTLYSIDTRFDTSTTDSFWKIVGKVEIAYNEQFFLFPQCFLLNQVIASPFVHIFHIISLFAAEFEEHKIGISGYGLRNMLSDITFNLDEANILLFCKECK